MQTRTTDHHYPKPTDEAWDRYGARFVYYRGGSVVGVCAGSVGDDLVMVPRMGGPAVRCDQSKGQLLGLRVEAR